MNYEGHAFHSGFPKGKASGTLCTTPQGIVFRREDNEVLLPYNGINIEMGGAANRIIFIQHPNELDWKLYTSDQAILQDNLLKTRVGSMTQIKKIKSKKRLLRTLTLSICIAIVLGFWGLWMLKTPLVNKISDQVPVEWEEKLGETGYTAFIAGKNIIDDEKLQADLEKMAATLIDAIDDKRYEFKFHIIEDSTMNAAALPGGHVIIHSGLILNVKKGEDLLGVLAHEIAHVNKRHSIRGLINNAGLFLVLQSMLGDITAIGGVVMNGGTQLLSLHNSREHETEADDIGWDYLIKANINPRGLIDCFKVMKEKTHSFIDEELEKQLSILSTHPAMDERIDNLEKKWDALENKDGFDEVAVDYQQFQQRLRSTLNKESDSQTSQTGEVKNEN